METKTIPTPRGPVVAEVKDDLVYARGIPYAVAARWQKPAPTSWVQPLECIEKCIICPQNAFLFEFVVGPIPIDRPMGDDCLRLSVTVPKDILAQKDVLQAPVIVWFHGGANISGGADVPIMDTSGLSRLGVVTVCVQYRIGLYGCVEIPGLAKPNLHVYDQIESLRWVKENIASFGGDPNCITIMGQSAGGWAVYNMILAPTEGLFHRAIIISSPLDIQPKGDLGFHVIKRLPAHVLQGDTDTPFDLLVIQEEMLEMRKKSMHDVSAGISDFTADRRRAPFPADIDKRLAERGDIDLLIGWTADDCLPLIRLVPAGLTAIKWLGSLAEYWIGQLATTLAFKMPSQRLAKQWNGRATTFEFQWFPPGSPLRACHCMDMAFLFGDWELWSKMPMMVGADPAVYARLAPLVKDMVVTFAKRGLDRKHINITGEFSEVDYV